MNGLLGNMQPGLLQTTPEPMEDILAQLQALQNPNHPKDAVYLAQGTQAPPFGMQPFQRPEGSLYTNNPMKAQRFMDPSLDDDGMAEILGYPQPKSQIGPDGMVVQATDPNGNVITEAATSPDQLPSTLEALSGHGQPRVMSPMEAQQRRYQASPTPDDFNQIMQMIEESNRIRQMQKGISRANHWPR